MNTITIMIAITTVSPISLAYHVSVEVGRGQVVAAAAAAVAVTDFPKPVADHATSQRTNAPAVTEPRPISASVPRVVQQNIVPQKNCPHRTTAGILPPSSTRPIVCRMPYRPASVRYSPVQNSRLRPRLPTPTVRRRVRRNARQEKQNRTRNRLRNLQKQEQRSRDREQKKRASRRLMRGLDARRALDDATSRRQLGLYRRGATGVRYSKRPRSQNR